MSHPKMTTHSGTRQNLSYIQAHLVFTDTQSLNKNPKELEFYQRSIKTTS